MVNHGAGDRHAPLFQPLIVGLFCLFLILLFLVTALMDLSRTESTLLDVFENKGATIIEAVEMIAQNKLKELMGISNRATVSFQDMDTIEEGFRLQEALLTRLIEFAGEVDRTEEGGRLAKESLETLAVEAGIRSIVIYNACGKAVIQSAPVPKELDPRLTSLLKGKDEIALNLHSEGTEENPLYLVGVRRKNSDGIILLVFGREGLQYWASRVVIQEAVEEGGWRKGVRYFMVVDSRGRLLAGAGDLPEMDAGEEADFKRAAIGLQDGRSIRRVIEGSPQQLDVYAPITLNGEKTDIAKIALEIEEVRQLRERNQAHIFFSTGLMMMAAVLAMLLFYRVQNRHLRKIQEMKERVSRSERLSSLGRLAAGVAHEIRNPLNAVSMAIQRIQREFEPAEPEIKNNFSHLITVIREEIRRLDRIIDDFVGPAREKRTEFLPHRLVDLLERVAWLAKEEADSRDIHIQCEWEDPDLVIYMDAARMHQAIFNIAKNAMESIKGPGTVTISVHLEGPSQVRIRITDTGVGIPAQDIERVFEFEYTTKEKGLGLGLPMAREIIEAHGGELKIGSEPGKETTVDIILPRRHP